MRSRRSASARFARRWLRTARASSRRTRRACGGRSRASSASRRAPPPAWCAASAPGTSRSRARPSTSSDLQRTTRTRTEGRMYLVKSDCYNKAQLCELKALWIDAGLKTIEDLRPTPVDDRKPQTSKFFTGNTATVFTTGGGGTVVLARPALTIDLLRNALQEQKDELATLAAASGDKSLLKLETTKLGKKRYRFTREHFRALLVG